MSDEELLIKVNIAPDGLLCVDTANIPKDLQTHALNLALVYAYKLKATKDFDFKTVIKSKTVRTLELI